MLAATESLIMDGSQKASLIINGLMVMGRVLARISKMSVKKSHSKNSACPDSDTNLLQSFTLTFISATS